MRGKPRGRVREGGSGRQRPQGGTWEALSGFMPSVMGSYWGALSRGRGRECLSSMDHSKRAVGDLRGKQRIGDMTRRWGDSWLMDWCGGEGQG